MNKQKCSEMPVKNKMVSYTKILLARNQYFLPCLSNPKCSCLHSDPFFSTSGMQSTTPVTLCALHVLHCQSSVGTSTNGGSTHSK